MSGMEPEVREFFKRIAQTVSVSLFFFLFHMTVGLYLNWAFFEERPHIGNIIYYLVFLITLAGLIYFYYRVWKGKL